jgi:hypothetical protein
MANEKDVRDAAGNVIGTAKAQVVRDKFGEIIGEVGPPEPEPGPSAEELIMQGFQQRVTDAENGIAAIAEDLAGHGNAAKLILDRIKLRDLNFKVLREEKAKVAALRAKMSDGKKQIEALRKVAGQYDQKTPFLRDLDDFLADLDLRLGVPAARPDESAHGRITQGLEKAKGEWS